MDLHRLTYASLILLAVAASCASVTELPIEPTEIQAAESPQSQSQAGGRTIDVIVRDPDLSEIDFTGVVLRAGLVEEYVEKIPKVELDTGANMRVESCEAAGTDPALAELRCFVTERDRWRSLGEMLAVDLDAEGTASLRLPDPDGLYSIWIDDILDDAGCGYSGSRRIPAHRDDVVMNLEAWCA